MISRFLKGVFNSAITSKRLSSRVKSKTSAKSWSLSLVISILAYIGLIVSDPATSPFYAIESALGKVGYSLIVPTMLFVIAVAVSVALGYIAIGIRFNRGEGGPGLIYEMLGIKSAMFSAARIRFVASTPFGPGSSPCAAAIARAAATDCETEQIPQIRGV